MKTFTFEGDVDVDVDVDGVDVETVAFDKSKLSITDDAMVPGSIARMQQLLNDDPAHGIICPFEAMDANTRTMKCRKLEYIPFEQA
jgi:hypothetical protein